MRCGWVQMRGRNVYWAEVLVWPRIPVSWWNWWASLLYVFFLDDTRSVTVCSAISDFLWLWLCVVAATSGSEHVMCVCHHFTEVHWEHLADHLIPASDAAPRHRSSTFWKPEPLTVPRCRLSTYGCRAFYYAGPAVWNLLLDELRNSDSFDSFKRFLKTILFSSYWCNQRISGFFNEIAI